MTPGQFRELLQHTSNNELSDVTPSCGEVLQATKWSFSF